MKIQNNKIREEQKINKAVWNLLLDEYWKHESSYVDKHFQRKSRKTQ